MLTLALSCGFKGLLTATKVAGMNTMASIVMDFMIRLSMLANVLYACHCFSFIHRNVLLT